MNITLTAENVNALILRLQVAYREMSEAVGRQWNGGTALRISIPARPDYDSDIVICNALRDAENMIVGLQKKVEELEAASLATEANGDLGALSDHVPASDGAPALSIEDLQSKAVHSC